MTEDPEVARLRREALADAPAELRAAVDRGEQVWSTEELRDDYEVLGYQAPFVVVKRRSDGAKGSLQFTHQPRWYFGWEPYKS